MNVEDRDDDAELERLRREIASLRARASELEPDRTARRILLEEVDGYAQAFLDSLPELPAYQETEDKGIGILDTAITDEPKPLRDLLAALENHVDRPGLNPASAGHLGYIPGGGLYASALGDYLAAVTNRYAGVFYPSPGAVRLENLLLRWLCDLVGYPKSAAGNLTSGGSLANLIGVVTARDARPLRASDFERAVVYSSEQAHHSLGKALRIAGLGESGHRTVPIDSGFRLRPDALEEMIVQDRKSGRIPFLVVASAGTTDTGVVDPVDEIADVCAQGQTWLHVDGAYGVLFLLCEEGRKVLRGLHRADSIVMDPHKTLFLPYGSGALLVKNAAHLARAHHYSAHYMQDTLQARDELAPADLSPELSKHFRGLRMWLPLMLHGVAPFRAALREKMLLARYFHRRLKQLPGFEVGPSPELSVVVFRYLPPRGDPDAFNEKLVSEIQRDGRVFLSSTRLQGRFTLRLAVSAFRTHLDTIERALDVIENKARVLAEGLGAV